ncbi:hypothetical protein [Bradyrhizobium sp. BRP23]|uniref:hypothetical protein n=1 Tax=Bradyrhizobium sp. BRP23 TaxID=2793820 RepID=UPI001CD4AE40|nr:hypothetical protein [Bradyrhizobium sp. BRP23]MCA1379288.1 hypothetical protein [Bradyrhizobium sp. BRP05]MCA1420552.1 hypothetical protein [Bradyrhizobium sp. BRP23]
MYKASLRISLTLLGVASLIWFSYALSSLWSTKSVREISRAIEAGDRLRPSALSHALSRVNIKLRFPGPDFLNAQALVRLAVAEKVIALGGNGDEDMVLAEAHLKFALSSAPSNGFLWLLLYSAQMNRSGFDQELLKFLNQSYLTAPLEGWIALRRNRTALAAYPMLSASTREKVLAEFAALVDSGFIGEAVNNLTGPGWPIHEELLISLRQVDNIPREALAKSLAETGLKLTVPGVEFDYKPWRRW